LNFTPRTWVTGEIATAAQMNAEVRDALTGYQAAWTYYTPTWTGLTVGNGTSSFQWTRAGKTAFVRGRFTLGSTSSVGGTTGFYPSMPTSIENAGLHTGKALLFDASASTLYTGAFVPGQYFMFDFERA